KLFRCRSRFLMQHPTLLSFLWPAEFRSVRPPVSLLPQKEDGHNAGCNGHSQWLGVYFPAKRFRFRCLPFFHFRSVSDKPVCCQETGPSVSFGFLLRKNPDL